MAVTVNSAQGRTGRIGLRATPAQELLLRRAAATARKSLTDFILDSACRSAEHTLVEQRLFLVSPEVGEHLLALFDAPAEENAGLQKLRDVKLPWSE